MSGRKLKKRPAKSIPQTQNIQSGAHQKFMSFRKEVTRSGETVSLEEWENVLGEVEIQGEPAVVRWAYGRTKNLGNFEFLRLDCGVSIPCAPGEVVQMFGAAQGLVRAALTDFMDKKNKKSGDSGKGF